MHHPIPGVSMVNMAAMRFPQARERGFTLIEVLASSLIASVVVGGTLMAFVTAARIGHAMDPRQQAEAALFGQETLERLRNRVGTDDPTFNPANPLFPSPASVVSNWQEDPLLDAQGNLLPGSPDSILGVDGRQAKRCYRMIKENCAGVVGDCYAVQVKVCWNGTLCPC